MGVGFWFYSGDSGVATAAYIQVSAALPYLAQAHQSLLRWYVDDVIAGGPFRPKKDVVPVPEGPGLGIELDPDGLGRCAEDFARNGELSQLDPGGAAYRRLRGQ
jgi:glucarate dehydratase